MSSITIPNLPLAISLDGTEELMIVQAGTSRRTTVGAVAAVNGNLSGLYEQNGALYYRGGSGTVTLIGPA